MFLKKSFMRRWYMAWLIDAYFLIELDISG
jgi:hypothetical protein